MRQFQGIPRSASAMGNWVTAASVRLPARQPVSGCHRGLRPALAAQKPGQAIVPWRDQFRHPGLHDLPEARCAFHRKRIGPAEEREVGDAFSVPVARSTISSWPMSKREVGPGPKSAASVPIRARRPKMVVSANPSADGLRNTAISPGQGTACAATSGRCAGWSSASCGRVEENYLRRPEHHRLLERGGTRLGGRHLPAA